MRDLRYPIGLLSEFPRVSFDDRNGYIEIIRAFPNSLKNKVLGLRPDELLQPYRPEGWNIAQVVHHCADSHLNAYTRFRLALTEDRPAIRPYFEHLWAELDDAKSTDLEASLNILEGVHERWYRLMLGMDKEQWHRSYIHPEYNDEYQLIEALSQYAWHCLHHLGHVDQAVEQL